MQTLKNTPVLLDAAQGITYLQNYLKWGLGFVGGLVLIWGIIAFFSAGAQNDSTGKITAGWIIGAGAAIIGATVLVAVFVTAPPAK